MNVKKIIFYTAPIVALGLFMSPIYLFGNIPQEELNRIIQKYESDFSVQLDRFVESFAQNFYKPKNRLDLPMADSKKLIHILQHTLLNQNQKNAILKASIHSIDPVLVRKAIHTGAQAQTEFLISLQKTITDVEKANVPAAYKEAMTHRLQEIIDIISSYATAAAA